MSSVRPLPNTLGSTQIAEKTCSSSLSLEHWSNVPVKETKGTIYQNLNWVEGVWADIRGYQGYEGVPAEFSRDWNKRLPGRWWNYATSGGNLFAPHSREAVRQLLLHKGIFSGEVDRAPTEWSRLLAPWEEVGSTQWSQRGGVRNFGVKN